MSFSQIDFIANQFQSISLNDLGDSKLMNRIDTKFLIPTDLLLLLLQECSKNYKILETNDARLCQYETLYYDTQGLDLYHFHQKGKLNRVKIRARKYINTGTIFFESKFKTNKNRTIKKRENIEIIKNEIKLEEEIKKNLSLSANLLIGKLWVNYTRITLFSADKSEKITLDFDLQLINAEKNINIGNVVFVEIKQLNREKSSFMDKMKDLKIRKGSMSKYCIATILLNETIKQNNFKKQLRRFNKIYKNDNITANIAS